MAIESRADITDRRYNRATSLGWLLVFFGVVVSLIIGVYIFAYRTGGTNDLGSVRTTPTTTSVTVPTVVVPAASSTTLTVPVTPSSPAVPRQP